MRIGINMETSPYADKSQLHYLILWYFHDQLFLSWCYLKHPLLDDFMESKKSTKVQQLWFTHIFSMLECWQSIRKKALEMFSSISWRIQECFPPQMPSTPDFWQLRLDEVKLNRLWKSFFSFPSYFFINFISAEPL